ncbi:MAG: TetR family transcriptional regulator [Nocardioidaceae bacterium]
MRGKDFDPDLALQRAMELFWVRGYEATGITDLTEHLGIARASLYATFRSKSELYHRALERYCLRQAGPLMEALEQPGPFLPVIEGLLSHLSDVTAGDEERRGCLVVNATAERIPTDPETVRQVSEHLQRDQDLLRRALERAQHDGEVRTNQSPTAQANFLVATILGLRVLGKATADRDQLHDVVSVAVGALRAEG